MKNKKRNRIVILSLILIGLLCLVASNQKAMAKKDDDKDKVKEPLLVNVSFSNVTFIVANTTVVTIANDTAILCFAFFLFAFGIYKEDSIIGFLSCFGGAFIFLSSIFYGLIDPVLHHYLYIIIFLALAVGVYKVFLSLQEYRGTKRNE